MRVLSKGWTWLAIVVTVVGALNTAEVIAVVGPKVGAIIMTASTILAALSRALQAPEDGQP